MAGASIIPIALRYATIMDLGGLLRVPFVLILAAWLAIAVHEAGHLLAGSLAGLRPLVVAMGPLLLIRGNGRLRFHLNRHPATWGGLVVCVPRQTDAPVGNSLVQRMLIYIAGGPAMSLLAAMAALGLMSALASPAWSAALALFATFSLALGAAALIPSTQPGGMQSDGRRLVRLMAGGSEAEQDAALIVRQAHAYSDEPPAAGPVAE
jgi:hypothetical protein